MVELNLEVTKMSINGGNWPRGAKLKSFIESMKEKFEI
jgi:hypothetical protein